MSAIRKLAIFVIFILCGLCFDTQSHGETDVVVAATAELSIDDSAAQGRECCHRYNNDLNRPAPHVTAPATKCTSTGQWRTAASSHSRITVHATAHCDNMAVKRATRCALFAAHCGTRAFDYYIVALRRLII